MWALAGPKDGPLSLDKGQAAVLGRREFTPLDQRLSRQQLSVSVSDMHGRAFVRCLGLNNAVLERAGAKTLLRKGADPTELRDADTLYLIEQSSDYRVFVTCVRPDDVVSPAAEKPRTKTLAPDGPAMSPPKRKRAKRAAAAKKAKVDEDEDEDEDEKLPDLGPVTGPLVRVWEQDGQSYRGVEIEPAKSGRASCRVCYKTIANGALRAIRWEKAYEDYYDDSARFVHLECYDPYQASQFTYPARHGPHPATREYFHLQPYSAANQRKLDAHIIKRWASLSPQALVMTSLVLRRFKLPRDVRRLIYKLVEYDHRTPLHNAVALYEADKAQYEGDEDL